MEEWVLESFPRFFLVFIIIPLLLLSIILGQLDTLSVPTQRRAIQDTIDEARKSHLNLENAAIMTKVAGFNRDLAVLQYYNSFILLDLFINDCVDETKPIQ